MKPQPKRLDPYENYKEETPIFSCSPTDWEIMIKGLSPRAVNSLSNLLAHRYLPMKRYKQGWILSCMSHLQRKEVEGSTPWTLITNEGETFFNYHGKIPW